MIKELENLSLVLDFITTDTAKKVINRINKKLASTLNASIVDVRRKEEAFNEEILLKSFDAFPDSGSPRDFVVKLHSEESTGIWSWIIENNKPVWIENISAPDFESPIANKVTKDEIATRYLHFSPDTKSIMATPMTTNKIVEGVYSVELRDSGIFNEATLNLMKLLSKYFLRIIKKSNIQKLKQKDTCEAIDLFCERIDEHDLKRILKTNPVGFISRPFNSDSREVELCINSFMKSNQIGAKHFSSLSSKEIITDEIMAQISSADFAIVDITGNSPNVVFELGVLMDQNKNVIILKDSKDNTTVPFNIQLHEIYRYKLVPTNYDELPKLQLWKPGRNKFEPIEDALKDFADHLRCQLCLP